MPKGWRTNPNFSGEEYVAEECERLLGYASRTNPDSDIPMTAISTLLFFKRARARLHARVEMCGRPE